MSTLTQDGWLYWDDGLDKPEHKFVARHLYYLLCYDEYRVALLYGSMLAFGDESTVVRFYHADGKHLTAETKVQMFMVPDYVIDLELRDLYYYLYLAFTRFREDDQDQESIDEFAAGLKFFRESCHIACDDSGAPIMED